MTDHKPRIGLVGIMQSLYDDMIPGITERQGVYARGVADHLGEVADVVVGAPIKSRDDAEQVMRDFAARELDGLLVVMLTYGPAMRVARLLAETRLPICLANIQPDPHVTPAWTMDDMTVNQGIHGAQDTANAMVRAARTFHVITEEWQSDAFRSEVGRWARAAAAVTAWRSLKIALFGYAFSDMGDIHVDEQALVRTLGPQVRCVAQGDLYRSAQAAATEQIDELLAFEDQTFAVDPRLSREEREDHARMQLGIERILGEGGYGAYSAHFDAIGEDGRFKRLPLAAASNLLAKGYGYAAEGDVLGAALVSAAHTLIGDANFSEMYAMDFPSDSVLMSHMGEGNWKIARQDEEVRLIKRPLGIGKLDDPPTVLFRYRPGAATIATLVSLGGERFRMVVAEGEILESERLGALEMPYGQFRPDSGLRSCLNAWLALGGTHHQAMNLGRHAESWRVFCALAGVEFERV